MQYNTEVLIVGAGPTGLMMASQLIRFGIKFRIIEKRAARTNESRAIGIQAKSMEIFQNLGIVKNFLEDSIAAKRINFYIDGKLKRQIDFTKIKINNTPFPAIYFLPQEKTEEFLNEFLIKHQIKIERLMELTSFSQVSNGVSAIVKKLDTGESETINCHYIVGCDGAHSTVRHQLNLEFIGASYHQEFMLADAKLNWDFPHDEAFKLFLSRAGLFAYIPLWKDSGRIMAAKMHDASQEEIPLGVADVEELGKKVTKTDLKLVDVKWLSRFHLHHRVVNKYGEKHAFLAGDSAHIHTPVGGQGMNTGLQDATNLAWKISFVLKGLSPSNLLETYQEERQKVGKVLVKTTDRIFGFLTAKGVSGYIFRFWFFPLFLRYITRVSKIQDRIFYFISQLGIKYDKNRFLQEDDTNADAFFKEGPNAGDRAPDAPLGDQTLFESFQNTVCNILVFKNEEAASSDTQQLKEKYQKIISVHEFKKNPDTQILYEHYGITSEGIYFIRPDGYIGFRCFGLSWRALNHYLEELFSSFNANRENT